MQQLQLLYLEIRQSGWTAVIAPPLVVLPFGIFLALYLLADRELLEIAFLAFRAGSLIVVCIAVISLLPVWLTPRRGEASLGYSRLMFAVAAILLLTLLTCEKFVKRG